MATGNSTPISKMKKRLSPNAQAYTASSKNALEMAQAKEKNLIKR